MNPQHALYTELSSRVTAQLGALGSNHAPMRQTARQNIITELLPHTPAMRSCMLELCRQSIQTEEVRVSVMLLTASIELQRYDLEAINRRCRLYNSRFGQKSVPPAMRHEFTILHTRVKMLSERCVRLQAKKARIERQYSGLDEIHQRLRNFT